LKEEVDFDYGMHRMRKIAGLWWIISI
jgi:hypothetical protein